MEAESLLSPKYNIPKFEVLATLQRQLGLGLAGCAFQSQHNLLGGLGLLLEHGLGLTSVTGLFAVVSSLSLCEQGCLEEIVSAAVWHAEWRTVEHTLPALYCVTLCWVCFLQSLPLQYVRRVLGTLTYIS